MIPIANRIQSKAAVPIITRNVIDTIPRSVIDLADATQYLVCVFFCFFLFRPLCPHRIGLGKITALAKGPQI